MPDIDKLSTPELRQLVVDLVELVSTLNARLAELEARNAILEAEVERLSTGPPSPGGAKTPDWVKRNVAKPAQPKPRSRRDCAYTRKRETATKTVQHVVENCPDCNRALHGGTTKRIRQIIDLPEAPVEVTNHEIISRWCGVCGKSVVPRVDFSSMALGNSRIGIRAMSLVAYLNTTCRMPVKMICQFLSAQFGLRISAGEIVEILHRVRTVGQSHVATLLQQLRSQPHVHADETGWRENGLNGYLWSFSTPRIRYYIRTASRAHDVPEEVLGDFKGTLSSDFYAGYNFYPGEHQRCWTHLLRDLDLLLEKEPACASVKRFCKAVRKLYREAVQFHDDNPTVRRKKRASLKSRTSKLAQKHIRINGPELTLAKRLEQFQAELFVFVEYPDLPPDNNPAERAIRPAVIKRKVSGGTRSELGSNTCTTLMTLFGTWHVRGENLLNACRAMLSGKCALEHVSQIQ